MRFDAWVEACLYDPAGGFYASGGAAGRRGDFLTSPEVGPLFGAVLARWMDAVWDGLGRPDGFTVVEAGAGPGTLARSVLAATPACLAAGRYVTVERSDTQRAGHPDGVEAQAGLPEGPITGVVVANELLDNLPFRLLVADGRRWREVHVGVTGDGTGDRFAEVVGDEADPPVAVEPVAGARLPVQDGAAAWVADALALVDRGAVLAVDYASTTVGLAARPVGEWLRTYRGHERGGAPTDAPGFQDVTVEVAVDQMPPGAAASTQADFLAAHGMGVLVEEGRRVWTERAGVADLAALMARSRIGEAEALRDPDGLGAFTVLDWRDGE